MTPSTYFVAKCIHSSIFYNGYMIKSISVASYEDTKWNSFCCLENC